MMDKNRYDIDGESSYDYFGRSVSLSDDGSIVAIGATWRRCYLEAGHVRIYENVMEPGLK